MTCRELVKKSKEELMPKRGDFEIPIEIVIQSTRDQQYLDLENAAPVSPKGHGVKTKVPTVSNQPRI